MRIKTLLSGASLSRIVTDDATGITLLVHVPRATLMAHLPLLGALMTIGTDRREAPRRRVKT